MSDDAPLDSSTAFSPPTAEELAALLPQYEVERLIAQGGMGAVYLGRQPNLDRPVAIKVLPPAWGDSEGFASRFQTEARSMAKLSHGNIVAVHDFGVTTEGHLYLIMEWVPGETLHQLIQRNALRPAQIGTIALQLCDALGFAHTHGILHRDVKPANVLINPEGRVKVADFGLARPIADGEEEQPLGTPGYAAPELTQHGQVVDHRSDLYSLGVVIYEMITGELPQRPMVSVTEFVEMSPAWDDVLVRALNPLPAGRYRDAAEMRAKIAFITTNRARVAHLPTLAPRPKSGGAFASMGKLLFIIFGLSVLAITVHTLMSKRAGGPAVNPSATNPSPIPAAPAASPVELTFAGNGAGTMTSQSPTTAQTMRPSNQRPALDSGDTEFLNLVGEMRSAWLNNRAFYNESAISDLKAKYLTALRRSLPTNPTEREFFLSQISFIANSQPPPEPAPDWPAALRPLYDTYKTQTAMLGDGAQSAKAEAKQANLAKLTALAQDRSAKPETAELGQRLHSVIAEISKLAEPPSADWVKSRLETLTSPPTSTRLAPLGGSR